MHIDVELPLTFLQTDEPALHYWSYFVHTWMNHPFMRRQKVNKTRVLYLCMSFRNKMLHFIANETAATQRLPQ